LTAAVLPFSTAYPHTNRTAVQYAAPNKRFLLVPSPLSTAAVHAPPTAAPILGIDPAGNGRLVESRPQPGATIGDRTNPATPGDPPTVIDRWPTQNLDSEQAVLGSISIDRDGIIEIADFLRPEDFYRQAHGRIYAAMLELFEHREPIDVVTVAEALERAGELEAVGGAMTAQAALRVVLGLPRALPAARPGGRR
jgi:hypothetical protein